MNQKLIDFLKIIGALFFLYLFLASIKLMGISFQLFGKGFAEQLIGSYSNPFVGLFTGILATSLVQSSSTTTSLVVGLVGGGVLPIEYAIPILMGANLGTTITNTLVSLSFVTRKPDFRRAFAGATVHDFFNMCTIVVFFPLEIRFHWIQKSAFFLTRVFEGVGGVAFTSPFKIAISPAVNGVKYLLMNMMSFPEIAAGVIMLIVAVTVVIISLIYLVKTLRALTITRATVFIDRFLFRNDFTAFLLGLFLTLAVQSSSVTTSLIVPLVAAGLLSLGRCYPATLGANLGTTVTAILASLATVSLVGGQSVNTAGITAAFAHLMFNVYGIAVFYPLRRIPIFCASRMADLAAKSKKWGPIFVFLVFFMVPFLIILMAS
jgi:sodium-dependent phosphate cotransporter